MTPGEPQSPLPSSTLRGAQLLYVEDEYDSVTVHFILQSLCVVEALQLCHKSPQLESQCWSVEELAV